ncbi:MAG TPA: GNAT family N-acetyltransferase [Myxococcaceae bacterium]|nr:GNAT family N-acetyltransferase [Myxococcaceae bacterium]
MEPIALRPCRQNDAAFLFGLHRVALGEYVAATWGWDDDDQRRRFEEAFIPADQQIITVGGVDAGVLRVADRKHFLEVGLLELLPEFQRRGVGTKLMNQVLEVARARGVAVRLQVLRTNPGARRLYERLGFVVVGQTATHLQMTKIPEA